MVPACCKSNSLGVSRKPIAYTVGGGCLVHVEATDRLLGMVIFFCVGMGVHAFAFKKGHSNLPIDLQSHYISSHLAGSDFLLSKSTRDPPAFRD